MATTNENKGFYKLSWLQRIGFGSGDLAQNLIFQTTCMYLLFFYTDIYGLDAVDGKCGKRDLGPHCRCSHRQA